MSRTQRTRVLVDPHTGIPAYVVRKHRDGRQHRERARPWLLGRRHKPPHPNGRKGKWRL